MTAVKKDASANEFVFGHVRRPTEMWYKAVCFQSIAAEILELKPQLEVLRSRLEDETLANAVLRNQTQSLREDYGSLKKVQEEVAVCMLLRFLHPRPSN